MIHSDGEFAKMRPPPFKATRFGYPVAVIVSLFDYPPLRRWINTIRGRVDRWEMNPAQGERALE